MRALVIDDDRRLLAEVETILRRNGYDADCVDNAAEALLIMEKHQYDLILVDYRMPKHDGIWFMEHASLPRHTKALLVTSYLDRKVIRAMFSAGVSGYVMKPFDEAELMRHIEFHFDSSLKKHLG